MSFNAAPGETLLIPTPYTGNHLFVVVTHKEPHTNRIIIVSFETARRNPDRTVVLNPGDHPFVQHQTVVGYRRAEIKSANDLINMVRNRIAFPRDPCSPELLQRIQEGVCRSSFTPNKIKEIYRDIMWPF